jgi:hypothetical protein
MSIVMRETTEEFRQGFEFCTRAIYDLTSNREGYTLEKLNETLSSMVTLMDKKSYWPDIKKVIIRD